MINERLDNISRAMAKDHIHALSFVPTIKIKKVRICNFV